MKSRTTDPAHLIINVYDSIIQDLDRALKDISKHKYRKASCDIISAQSALSKLLYALSMAEGDEFYINLSKIYMYLKKLLPTATSSNDTEKIRCVIDHMTKLREMWDGTPHQ
jgi:flagellar biosynthetic protein FliS